MITNGQKLQNILDDALAEGEIPYKANRDAVREFDIFGDVRAGLVQIGKMVSGIDVFVRKLEGLKDVSAEVASRSDAFVR